MSDKETFQMEIEEQLEKWKSQIDSHSQKLHELKLRAEKLEAEAKLQYLEQIKELEVKIEDVKSKMGEGEHRLATIKDAGEEAWDEVKTGSQNAWEDMVRGVNKGWDEVRSSFELASSKIRDGISKK
ncbi:hypothetical protein [Candidatus Nitronereus thalassa]|uniref:Coiled coil domain-containing protein n=1 Tax=Candidatus Nitronereus thalassa TaxID=3020898 RepID=A0ABU3KC60_9BACT|nr:hypothetical protein [Candidatus Nitronereus thalassa]MDT7043767.1 hypothetical protein [Candidatus Nitronereus thalassa]